MARITIDDGLDRIDNRFDLTLIASVRARQIDLGATIRIDQIQHPSRGRDKSTVIALREIAAGLVGTELLHRSR